MATENLECPAARKWLLPYLGGQLEGSNEGTAFEKHVITCGACRELVSDRRKAMRVLLAAANEEEEASPVRAATKSVFAKNKMALVFGGIAIALVAVSYAMRPGADLILGEKVAEAKVPATSTTETPPAKPLQVEKNRTTASETAAKPAPPTTIPKTVTPKKPTPAKRTIVVIRHAPKRKPIMRRHAPKRAAVHNRVEVFDENGRRIGGRRF